MLAQSLSRRSRRARSATGLITIVLTCSLMLIAPRGALAQHHAAPFVNSGTVTFVTDQTPSDIDPANNEVAGSDVIARSVAEPLVAPDGSSITRFKPVLATSWKTNANKSVWTFYLRHGVKFHTGRCCMTAEDVKYSLARTMLAGLVNSFGLARFMTNPMKQIKVIDPYTVEFDLGRPQPLFINQLSSLYMSLILDSRALKAHEKKHDWGHAWATDHDAGTGPYVIQSWIHNQQVVLTRFPGYWGGWSGRHFSKVIVRTVPETSTRRELVERGQADLTFDLTPEDNLALSHNPAVKVIAPYGTEVEFIYMTEAGPLASTYARQALSYAFNYDAVIKGVFKGYARRAYGCLPSTMLGYDPNQFHYHTDLNKARELLQKAGVKPGTTLTYATYNSIGNKIGLILQAQLAQLGLNLKMQQLTEAAFTTGILYSSLPANKRPNLMAWGWWPDFDDPYDECNILLNSASAGSAGANAGFYHNKQVDALLNKMKNAAGEELISLAHKMQEVAALDPPAIWTDEPAQVTVMVKSLRGYVFNPVELQTYDFYSMYRS
jgi:peptide/nickel transport system substrate-binding protein